MTDSRKSTLPDHVSRSSWPLIGAGFRGVRLFTTFAVDVMAKMAPPRDRIPSKGAPLSMSGPRRPDELDERKTIAYRYHFAYHSHLNYILLISKYN